MRSKKKKNGESGQAIIEFIIVISMILTMIFLLVQVAWGIAFGHYVHYATYMASRAYLSSAPTRPEQYEAAASVLRSSLSSAAGGDLLPFLAKARTGDDRDVQGTEPVPGAAMGFHSEARGRETSRKYSWAEGVQYNYNLRLFLLPLASFIAKDGEGKTIQPGTPTEPAKVVEWRGVIPFTSDSYLGREPTTAECVSEMVRISRNIGIERLDGKIFIEDNGC